ncbi:hypothetical protein QYF36_012229 [Acer negundo]|nr:hypothetical protein QYF36_012229 [Acer negundo]
MDVHLSLVLIYWVRSQGSNHRSQDRHTRQSTSSAPSTRSSTTHPPWAFSPEPHPSRLREVDNFSTTAFDGRHHLRARPSTSSARPTRSSTIHAPWASTQSREVTRCNYHVYQSKEVDNLSTRAFNGRQ